MSPRPYRLGQRQAAIDETRARVIAAARELLVSADPGKFSIDAVAQHADVSRATVYYQFRSKAGLLEALFAALDEYIMVFGRFWGSDQVLHRRLRGLAALDPDLGEALRVRQEWRRRGAATLITRLTTELGAPPATRQRDATDLLFTVTSFETFDTLAGAGTPQAAVSLIQHLAHAALTLPVFPE